MAFFVPSMETSNLREVSVESFEERAEYVLEFVIAYKISAILYPSDDPGNPSAVVRCLIFGLGLANTIEQLLCSTPFSVEDVENTIPSAEGSSCSLEFLYTGKGVQMEFLGKKLSLCLPRDVSLLSGFYEIERSWLSQGRNPIV